MSEEIKKELRSPDLGQATSPNLGQVGSPIKEEIKVEPDNGKIKPETKPEIPPTDFKIAEIWIKGGQLFIEAPEEFWRDKFRARGVLCYCDEMVRDFEPPRPKIIPAKGSFLNGVRNIFNKRRR